MCQNISRIFWCGMSNTFRVRSNAEFIFFLMRPVKLKISGIVSEKEIHLLTIVKTKRSMVVLQIQQSWASSNLAGVGDTKVDQEISLHSLIVAQSCPTLCDPQTIAHQAPLSMEFSRQEYLSGLPFPPSGDLPNPGIEPVFPILKVDSLPHCYI